MKKWNYLLLLLLAVLFLHGCGGEKEPQGTDKIYYLNQEATGIEAESCKIEGETTEEKVSWLLERLVAPPESPALKPVLPEKIRVLKYTLDRQLLYLDFSTEYMELDKATEVLARAAIVKTLTQLEDVRYIAFTVAGESLKDSKGNGIGLMNENTFLDNMGSEENATKIIRHDLYFANKAGDKLKCQPSIIEYNANVPVDKVIVERLIGGPTDKGCYATIPKDTKIISVTTKDGVCYVNLDSGFMSQGYDVLGAVTIYSIVNSLTGLPDITSVQILVNGETSGTYKGNISLETIFQKNTDIIEQEE